MKLNAWGNQAHNAFNGGIPIEFVMHSGDLPEKGNQIEIKFFNGNGPIDTVQGVVEHVEPGLIKITKKEE